MTNIIQLYPNVINENTVDTVNARELHGFLDIGRDYTTWISARIEKFGFSEGIDFVVEKIFPQNGGKIDRGRPALEYHLTLDMAKELSMVENNGKGREARRYFIECERRAREGPVVLDLENPAQLRGLLSNYLERTEKAEALAVELEPKAQAFDRLGASEGSVTPRVAAKTLGMPERRFTKWLEVNGWAFRQGGRGPLQAYAERGKQGHLEHKLHTFVDSHTGDERTRAQLMITPKGMARLARIFSSTEEAA